VGGCSKQIIKSPFRRGEKISGWSKKKKKKTKKKARKTKGESRETGVAWGKGWGKKGVDIGEKGGQVYKEKRWEKNRAQKFKRGGGHSNGTHGNKDGWGKKTHRIHGRRRKIQEVGSKDTKIKHFSRERTQATGGTGKRRIPSGKRVPKNSYRKEERT